MHWGEFYATKIYPGVSAVLSWLAAPFGFSLTEIVVVAAVLSAVWLAIRAVRKKKRWWRCLLGETGIALGLVVWLYAGWGFNYFRYSVYTRLGTAPMPYEEAEFQEFLNKFSEQLNANWCPAEEREKLDIKEFETYVKEWYGRLPEEAGLCKPRPWQHPKRLLFNRLYSAVGVLGFIGPAFDEMHVNREITILEHPFVFAHEYAHVLGVSSEAEANFWAFEATRASDSKAVRYSAWYLLLSFSWSNIRSLLGDDAFFEWTSGLRPEILDDLRFTQEYWHSRRSDWLSSIQHSFYNFFLKSNRIPDGTKNYGQVLRMVMTLSDLHDHDAEEE